MAEDQVIAAANVVLRKVSGHDGGPLLHSGKGDGLLDQSLHGRQVEKDARTLRGIPYDGIFKSFGKILSYSCCKTY